MSDTYRIRDQRTRVADAQPVAWRVTLVVDPIQCDGHGVCAELFPERVTMDRWGYPIIDNDDIPLALLDHARRAVTACPRLALHLMEGRG
jgi:ferredoxin